MVNMTIQEIESVQVNALDCWYRLHDELAGSVEWNSAFTELKNHYAVLVNICDWLNDADTDASCEFREMVGETMARYAELAPERITENGIADWLKKGD